MAFEVSTILTRFTTNLAQYEGELARAERRTLEAAGNMGRAGGGAFGQMGIASIAMRGVVVASFGAAALAGLAYRERIDRLQKSFETFTGSAQGATQHLKELQQFANRTPFEFEDVARASQKFQNMGRSASEVIPLLTAVGEAVARAGGGKEQIEGVSKALSDVMARGKVSAQEMNQLANNLVDGWKPLEKELGKTRGELFKMAEAGEITADTFVRAFQNTYGGGQAMQRQMGTLTGALSTLKDAGKQFLEQAITPLHAGLRDVAVEMAKVATEGVNVGRSWDAAKRSFIDFALEYAKRSQSNPQRVAEFFNPQPQQQTAPGREVDTTGKKFLDDFKARREALEKELNKLGGGRDVLRNLQAEISNFGDTSKVAQVTETFRRMREEFAKSGEVFSAEATKQFDSWQAASLAAARRWDALEKQAQAAKKAREEEERQAGVLQGVTQDYKEAALRVQLYAQDSLQLEAALYRLSKGYETLSDANKQIVDADVNRIFSAKAGQKLLDENADLQKKANDLLKEQAQALGAVESPLQTYYGLLKKSADISSDLYQKFGLKLPEGVKDGVDKSIFQLLRLQAVLLQIKQAMELAMPNEPVQIPGIDKPVESREPQVTGGSNAPDGPWLKWRGEQLSNMRFEWQSALLAMAEDGSSTFGRFFQDLQGGWQSALGNMGLAFMQTLQQMAAQALASQVFGAILKAVGSGIGGGSGFSFGGGGGVGIFGGAGAGGGFATGGSFMVGGPSGRDKTPVAFMATRGERVTVETPAQQRSRATPQTVNNYTTVINYTPRYTPNSYQTRRSAREGFESLLAMTK